MKAFDPHISSTDKPVALTLEVKVNLWSALTESYGRTQLFDKGQCKSM